MQRVVTFRSTVQERRSAKVLFGLSGGLRLRIWRGCYAVVMDRQSLQMRVGAFASVAAQRECWKMHSSTVSRL